jgi:hypothetical protein
MSQAGYTPIQLYHSTTAAATPSTGNLNNGELAINITDGLLYYKDNSGNLQTIGAKLGTGVAAFLTTPSAANLATAVTDETGSGALVFATTPSLTTPTITAEREVASSLSGTSIDVAIANYFYKTISGNTTFTVTGTPTSGIAQAFVLELTNAGAYTITWFANLTFPGGTAPTLTASGRDVLAFFTRDGGTTWSGFVVGKDVKGP